MGANCMPAKNGKQSLGVPKKQTIVSEVIASNPENHDFHCRLTAGQNKVRVTQVPINSQISKQAFNASLIQSQHSSVTNSKSSGKTMVDYNNPCLYDKSPQDMNGHQKDNPHGDQQIYDLNHIDLPRTSFEVRNRESTNSLYKINQYPMRMTS